MCHFKASVISMLLFVHDALLQVDINLHLNTQQVFNGTALPLDVEKYSNKTFTLLVRPDRCSYYNLTSCHVNEDTFNHYHLQCYSAICSKKSYYCLNNPYGNTMHICGRDDKCYHKRRRNIAEIIPNDLYHVRVYSIPCQIGYVQTHRNDCFSHCIYDKSIIVKGKTKDNRILARCNAKEGYCNARNETYFEIGSSEDDCKVADDDLNITCDVREELMPDCSCVNKCKPKEERDWNDTLACMQKDESAFTETVKSFSVKTDQMISPEKKSSSEQPLYTQNRDQNTPQLVERSYKPGNGQVTDHGNPPVLTILLSCFGTAFVIIVIGISAVVYWKRKNKKGGHQSIRQQDTERAPEPHNRRIYKEKKIFNNPIYIGTHARKVEVNRNHRSLEKLIRNQYLEPTDTPQSKESSDHAFGQANEEQCMHCLKTFDGKLCKSDSGINITNETKRKSILMDR